jgi:hypothetical protein
MKVYETRLPGVYLIEPRVFPDPVASSSHDGVSDSSTAL